MKIAYIFIPFAFNGPCISENGPKVLEWFLKKNNYQGDYYMFQINWDESPIKYMDRIFCELKKIEKKYHKIIVFGGNHLSLLPVYLLTEKLKYNSVTLDAHRDYLYNDGEITHGSFLRFIKKEDSKRYILGFRDEIKDKDQYKFFDEEVAAEELTDNLSLKNINYIDIDVDVLDEKVFPYTVCKKENGLTLNRLFDLLTKLNLKDVKILSLSEYAYVLDNKKEGLKIIVQIINEFLKI